MRNDNYDLGYAREQAERRELRFAIASVAFALVTFVTLALACETFQIHSWRDAVEFVRALWETI